MIILETTKLASIEKDLVRSLTAEIKSTGKSWYQLERDARDRRLWRESVDGLMLLRRSEG